MVRLDRDIEKQTGISREDHENRNKINEMPTGKLTPSPEDPTTWVDEAEKAWKLVPEKYASENQPMRVPLARLRAVLGKPFPFLKVPNLKFISTNAEKGFSEICANRFTGKLIIEQEFMGTMNLCTDAPDDVMATGIIPNKGEHRMLDILPHYLYGPNYKQITKDVELGSIEEAPVVLGKTEMEVTLNMWLAVVFQTQNIKKLLAPKPKEEVPDAEPVSDAEAPAEEEPAAPAETPAE